MTRLSDAQRERFLALLREKRALMERFAGLTDRQAALIAGSDGAALAASFGEGAAIAREFDGLRVELESLAAVYAGSDVRDGEIDGLTAKIDAFSGSAAAKNSENAEAVRAGLAKMGSRLAEMSQNRKGVLGYASVGAYGVSEVLDKMT